MQHPLVAASVGTTPQQEARYCLQAQRIKPLLYLQLQRIT
jgi:hypothetical protein